MVVGNNRDGWPGWSEDRADLGSAAQSRVSPITQQQQNTRSSAITLAQQPSIYQSSGGNVEHPKESGELQRKSNMPGGVKSCTKIQQQQLSQNRNTNEQQYPNQKNQVSQSGSEENENSYVNPSGEQEQKNDEGLGGGPTEIQLFVFRITKCHSHKTARIHGVREYN